MTLSRHDATMLAATAAILFFGLLGASWGRRMQAIRDRRDEVRTLEERLFLQRELIAARDLWEARYAKVSDQIFAYGPSDQVEEIWWNKIDGLAAGKGLRITQRQTKEETVVAGVHELPLEVRAWDGTLLQLVDFLDALHREGAMLAVRSLNATPDRNRQGYLSGSLLLHCAFLRTSASAPTEKQP